MEELLRYLEQFAPEGKIVDIWVIDTENKIVKYIVFVRNVAALTNES